MKEQELQAIADKTFLPKGVPGMHVQSASDHLVEELLQRHGIAEQERPEIKAAWQRLVHLSNLQQHLLATEPGAANVYRRLAHETMNAMSAAEQRSLQSHRIRMALKNLSDAHSGFQSSNPNIPKTPLRAYQLQILNGNTVLLKHLAGLPGHAFYRELASDHQRLRKMVLAKYPSE